MRGDAAHPWARWLAVLGVPSGFLWLLLIHGCGRMTTLWCQYGIKTSCTISCGGRPCQNLNSCRRVIKFSTLGAEGDDHEWRRIQSKHLFMAESSVPGSGGRAWRRESGWQSRAIGPAMVQRIRRARSLRVGFGDVMSLEGPKRRGVSAEVE
jgi:hypothetical protein